MFNWFVTNNNNKNKCISGVHHFKIGKTDNSVVEVHEFNNRSDYKDKFIIKVDILYYISSVIDVPSTTIRFNLLLVLRFWLQTIL